MFRVVTDKQGWVVAWYTDADCLYLAYKRKACMK